MKQTTCLCQWIACAMLALLTTLPAVAQTPDTTTTTEIMFPDTLPKPTISHHVALHTTQGTIILGLYDDTPIHRDNFLELVERQAYDSTIFHRVIRGFMIQGGDLERRRAQSEENAGLYGYYTIKTLPAEIQPHLYHKRGALAAARLGDAVNPERNSSGSQFYIVWGAPFYRTQLEEMVQQKSRRLGKPFVYSEEMIAHYMNWGGTPHLDGEYTVFGEVIEGLDVVERIQNVPTDEGDKPYEDIRILRAEVVPVAQ